MRVSTLCSCFQVKEMQDPKLMGEREACWLAINEPGVWDCVAWFAAASLFSFL
jgi:hypothetical protein